MQKVIRVRVTDEMKEKFDLICKKKSLNASQLLRNWLEEFIKENEKLLK